LSAAILILGLVTAQRLAELVIARRNTRALLGQGAYEVGAAHYPMIVGTHLLWLASLWWLIPGRPIVWPLVGVYALLQAFRFWTLASLGRRWTTRIIILPGEELVKKGPYRLLSHPNYAVVVAEIAILPLAFGLVPVALFFSLLNAIVLAIRIRAESRALALLRTKAWPDRG
jgi:methyltransferase